MHTGKLEQYKRLIRFGFNILLLAILIFFFIHIWDENYNDGIVFPFYYKGYLMIFLYFRRNEDRIFKKQQFNVVADACFVGIKCADLFGDSSFVGEIHSC